MHSIPNLKRAERGRGDIVIIGHRATGKTALGHLVATRTGRDFVDLDREIELREGRTCGALVAENPQLFRELEAVHLRDLLDDPAAPARVIVPGAGCEYLPPGPLYIWLARDGWEESAREERARLRPELSFEAEVAWMRATREPRWQARAHLHFCIPRGRGVEEAAAQISTYLRWVDAAPEAVCAPRTFMVPTSPNHLERAVADAAMLGLAGVELRSDFFPEAGKGGLSVGVLASLRTPQPAWLRELDAALAYDVDSSHLEAVLASGVLRGARPRPLIVSSHPPTVTAHDADQLLELARHVGELLPEWAAHVALKYAPAVGDFNELERARATSERLRGSGLPVTFLPQGANFAWTRPILARQNATNYMPVGLNSPGQGGPVPFDLQAWLPHLVPAAPEIFDALIGGVVHGSVGDFWHNDVARSAQERVGYVKIPVAEDQVERALSCLRDWPIRGVSVTSPHKHGVLDCPAVANPERLVAANTLRRTDGGWLATDTDGRGMAASLSAIESAGINPGTVAIFGRGGVSPAVLAALEGSAWQLVHHASARAGWGADAPKSVDLVVNAAGPQADVRGAPACQAWIDLHYIDVAEAPRGAVHVQGDAFFAAQAHAQRRFWNNDSGSEES